MPLEFETFVEDPEHVKEKMERNISIRELTPDVRKTKYRTRYVKALVFPDPVEGKDDLLHIRYLQGERFPKPFGITILQELGPFEVKEKSVFTS
ncbi:MAG: hypothetical protein SV775_17165 [Thermodesulfobacteriota bacterium]|nr:hypothetical protein [Thermodesulfobacteriota bacterium]